MTELTVQLRGRGKSGREFQRYLLKITTNASSARKKHLSLCTILLLVGMTAYFLLYKIVMMHAHRLHGKLVWKETFLDKAPKYHLNSRNQYTNKKSINQTKCPKLEQ